MCEIMENGMKGPHVAVSFSQEQTSEKVGLHVS